SKERNALLRGQVSTFLWNGKIGTTLAKAKATARMAEKIITIAINAYEDTIKVVKDIKGADGKKVKTEVLNDGPKKLAARRKIMGYVYDLQEQRKPKESLSAYKARIEGINHPLIEKIFNVYAPKYAERARQSGQGGGYTRVIKLGARRGDATQMAIVELV
ncbi:MAG: L17 family ribosomal protein, partial [Clostridia bacterium]|nr:L17 family ribosomal protein [Clostridia bacterium]